MKRPGFSLTETLITGALVGVLVIVGTLLLSSERARTRDVQRLADMTRLSSGFALLFATKASYSDAAVGCPKVGSNAAACTLTEVLPGLEKVADPGRFQYTVTKVPDRDNFGIQFQLERRYGSLGAGAHTLTKQGIR